jgi:hypothetical protein
MTERKSDRRDRKSGKVAEMFINCSFYPQNYAIVTTYDRKRNVICLIFWIDEKVGFRLAWIPLQIIQL